MEVRISGFIKAEKQAGVRMVPTAGSPLILCLGSDRTPGIKFYIFVLYVYCIRHTILNICIILDCIRFYIVIYNYEELNCYKS